MIINLVSGDLFTSSDSLVHCVSADMRMSKGIALQFKQRFQELSSITTYIGVGEVLPVKTSDNRYIFNLITKERFYHKPNYSDVERCLKNLGLLTKLLGVNSLSMPRIASGLDRLDWDKVFNILHQSMQDIPNLRITVYSPVSGSTRYSGGPSANIFPATSSLFSDRQ